MEKQRAKSDISFMLELPRLCHAFCTAMGIVLEAFLYKKT
jgi:hypothetical protein